MSDIPTLETPPTPPSLPPLARPVNRKPGLFPRFEEEFAPASDTLGPLKTIEYLLKRPASLVCEVGRGQGGRLMLMFLLIAALCVGLYGFVVGSFAGGSQLWAAPLKAVVGLGFGAAICFPSLYIFLCLQGGQHSIPETATFLAMAVAMAGLLLLGLAPVAWVFAQSTGTLSFMGIMHLFFVGVALRFGLGLLAKTFRLLNERELGALRLWVPVFVVVLFQVMTMLRPIIGSYEGLQFSEKLFFLAHWWDVLGG